jgi:hypothetical protein
VLGCVLVDAVPGWSPAGGVGMDCPYQLDKFYLEVFFSHVMTCLKCFSKLAHSLF